MQRAALKSVAKCNVEKYNNSDAKMLTVNRIKVRVSWLLA